MTLKNARIYQELLRRLSHAEPAHTHPVSERRSPSRFEQPARLRGGERPGAARSAAIRPREWNGQN